MEGPAPSSMYVETMKSENRAKKVVLCSHCFERSLDEEKSLELRSGVLGRGKLECSGGLRGTWERGRSMVRVLRCIGGL